jgi:hypothetical protein
MINQAAHLQDAQDLTRSAGGLSPNFRIAALAELLAWYAERAAHHASSMVM